MIPLIGFAPDADPTTQVVITDCTNFIPYLNGMEGGPAAINPVGVSALADACRGAAVINQLDNTRRTFAGTSSNLYELTTGWTSVGSGYTLGSDSRWSFAQFGNATIAATISETLQRSTSGAFTPIAGAPKADIVFSVGAFLMALNTNDGAVNLDGWHCSASFDDTDWTPSITTQSAKGRLVSSPGALTAGAGLGEYAVAYKARSIFLGQYVGAPSVWDWISVPGGDVGCVGKEALCDIGNIHFFVGEDNFYIFDGTAPTPIADNTVRNWFNETCSPGFRYKTKCVYDRQTDRVWVFFPSKNSSDCDSALVWHVKAKRWGRADRPVQAVLNYVSNAVTFDTWDTTGATFDALPNVSFDSQFWNAGGRSLSVFNASNQLQILDGLSSASSFTTGEYGDDDLVSLLTEIRLRYAKAPSSGTCQTFFSFNSGTSFANGSNGALNDGKFDVLQTGRWHKARFDFTGPVQVTAINAKTKPSGQR